MSESRMSERSETESERDLDGIDVVSEPDASSKRSSLRSQQGAAGALGALEERGDSAPAPHQVLLAAAYLDDACTGCHMEFQPTVSAVRLYTTYKNKWFTGALYFSLAIILALAIFEEPEAAPIKNSLHMPFPVTVSIEILCLAFLLFRLAQEFLFSVKGAFWRDAKHVVQLAVLVLMFLDIAIYTGLYESDISSVRWSRPLRPLLLVNIPEGRQIRRAFRNIRRTLPGVLSVLVLFLLVLFLFAMMFFKLFSNKKVNGVPVFQKIDGQPYFATFADSYWDLYILVTTANNPDIMMPAYNKHSFYAIFFIVFEAVSLYIFMSIFLAVVYNNYKTNLKREVKEAIERMNDLIDKSFDLMKSDVFGREVIIEDDFKKLMKRTMNGRSDQYFRILWLVLDEDKSGYIDRQEFHNLPDLLNIKITEVRENLFQRYIPNVYNSNYSKKLISLVKHKYFRYVFDGIILVNAFVILANVDYIEWVFLAVFTLEILLKMYSFGFYMYFGKLWNIFDFVIIGAALIFDIVDEARGDDEDANVILDILLILRVMRIVKILHSVNYFKSILNTILHILPSLLTYAGVLFVFFYIYAMVGMESFKNRIRFFGENTYKPDLLPSEQKYCGIPGNNPNPDLQNFKDSSFYKFQYCANNFNDFGSSMVLLLELLVVNQWHILTDGFVLATGTKATRLFFISFHMICVLLILNIFTAFVIEAFLLEYTYSKGSLETALQTKINEMGLAYGSRPIKKKKKSNNKKAEEQEHEESILDDQDEIDDDVDADHDNLQFVRSQLAEIVANYTNYSKETPIRFHLKKGGTTNVHTLLQKMFQQELLNERGEGTNGATEIGDNTQFDAFN